MSQMSALAYAQAIQPAIQTIFGTVPVYASFNRNYANEPKFVTWHMRNIHQPVYAGTFKGIDRPIVQVTIFAKTMTDAFTMGDTLLTAWHGFTGLVGGLSVSKIDCAWLYDTYDDTIGLHQVVVDCQFDVPT